MFTIMSKKTYLDFVAQTELVESKKKEKVQFVGQTGLMLLE